MIIAGAEAVRNLFAALSRDASASAPATAASAAADLVGEPAAMLACFSPAPTGGIARALGAGVPAHAVPMASPAAPRAATAPRPALAPASLPTIPPSSLITRPAADRRPTAARIADSIVALPSSRSDESEKSAATASRLVLVPRWQRPVEAMKAPLAVPRLEVLGGALASVLRQPLSAPPVVSRERLRAWSVAASARTVPSPSAAPSGQPVDPLPTSGHPAVAAAAGQRTLPSFVRQPLPSVVASALASTSAPTSGRSVSTPAASHPRQAQRPATSALADLVQRWDASTGGSTGAPWPEPVTAPLPESGSAGFVAPPAVQRFMRSAERRVEPALVSVEPRADAPSTPIDAQYLTHLLERVLVDEARRHGLTVEDA